MSKQIANIIAALSYTSMADAAAQTVAALQGNAGAFETTRQFAFAGRDALEEFADAVRARLAETAGLPADASMNIVHKAKVPGAAKFVLYLSAFRKVAGDAAKVAAVTMAELNGSAKKKAAKKADAKKADASESKVPVSRTATPDDLIAALQAHHEQGTLTPAHYATLQAMVTIAVAKKAPVEA